MLVKLLPDQVSNNWDTIGYAIESSLPPIAGESDEKMNNILMALLDGRMECWVSLNSDDRISAVTSTRIMEDDVTRTRSLLLYSIFTFDWADEDTWIEGLETLVKYARGKNCTRITGYTEFDSMIKRAREMGGEARYMFVAWPV